MIVWSETIYPDCVLNVANSINMKPLKLHLMYCIDVLQKCQFPTHWLYCDCCCVRILKVRLAFLEPWQ